MRDLSNYPSRGEKRYRIQVLLDADGVTQLKEYMAAAGVQSESAAMRQLAEIGYTAFFQHGEVPQSQKIQEAAPSEPDRVTETPGQRLGVLISKKNITQKALAEMTGILEPYISQYKTGKKRMSPEHVIALEKVLDAASGYLRGEVKEQEMSK